MFESTFAWVGLQFARFQFRNDIQKVQTLTDFFTGARSVLIALPVGYDHAILASNALREFRQQLNHLHLTVVHTGTRATSLTDYARCEVIRIDPEDVNKFSLPNRSLLQRIESREYDTAIDLNLDFVLHTAYICKASGAKVRVSFAQPASDIFFNVQLNLKTPGTPQAIYNRFAACLAMF